MVQKWVLLSNIFHQFLMDGWYFGVMKSAVILYVVSINRQPWPPEKCSLATSNIIIPNFNCQYFLPYTWSWNMHFWHQPAFQHLCSAFFGKRTRHQTEETCSLWGQPVEKSRPWHVNSVETFQSCTFHHALLFSDDCSNLLNNFCIFAFLWRMLKAPPLIPWTYTFSVL